jgi:hypothetical protein
VTHQATEGEQYLTSQSLKLDSRNAQSCSGLTGRTSGLPFCDFSYRRYTQAKVAEGRYLGERTVRFEYKEETSDWFEWVHVDPVTLEEYVRKAGYVMEALANDGRRFLVSIRKN